MTTGRLPVFPFEADCLGEARVGIEPRSGSNMRQPIWTHIHTFTKRYSVSSPSAPSATPDATDRPST